MGVAFPACSRRSEPLSRPQAAPPRAASVNPSAATMCGWSDEEATGLNVESVVKLVNDKGVAVGCLSEAFDSEDRMTTHLVNLIRDKMGPEHSGSISSDFVDVDAKRILRVHCSPSPRPVFVKSDNDELFYVRLLAATEPLSVRQAQTYIATRWHSGA